MSAPVAAAAALPGVVLTDAPPKRGHVALFWLPSALLFAIACIGSERWRQLYAGLPEIARDYLAAPVGDGFAAFEASLFLACLCLVIGRNLAPFRRILRALRPDDFRHALYAVAALEILSLVTRPSSLGIDYQRLSLAPFGQETGVLNRRLLDVALSYYSHLNGAFFILFHFLTVFLLLALTRAFLRRLGAEPKFPVFLSLATSSFVIFNFQYPGYPDPLLLVLVLAAVTAELDRENLLLLIVLALLTHEALAVALFLPLLLPLPRRAWPIFALPFVLYGMFWIADFGFDLGAGWNLQMHFQGLSGPEAALAKPAIVLFGLLAAYKLLWLAIGDQLVHLARRAGGMAALRFSAPLIAMLILCILSYDTSRMAEAGFLVLLLAWSGCATRWRPWTVTTVAIVNLLLPSVYVTPYFDRPLGIVWPPGLYSAYHGFRTDALPSD